MLGRVDSRSRVRPKLAGAGVVDRNVVGTREASLVDDVILDLRFREVLQNVSELVHGDILAVGLIVERGVRRAADVLFAWGRSISAGAPRVRVRLLHLWSTREEHPAILGLLAPMVFDLEAVDEKLLQHIVDQVLVLIHRASVDIRWQFDQNGVSLLRKGRKCIAQHSPGG